MSRLTHVVDVPGPVPGDGEAWIAVDYFFSESDAIAFAQKHYGADEKGRVCLVSALPQEDDPEEETC